MNEVTLRVPPLGSSDESCEISWDVSDGDFVKVGQTIGYMMTAKVGYDLDAEVTGFISLLVPSGTEVEVGQEICIIIPYHKFH